ncbi:hypothetical protein ILUMI_00164 [Ignelater luminosus]|uniref:Cytochrome P450 n=1 Tax=Ignelater luminosus TaxID=2038154 RepID=A0A8K0DKS1_IGNLU|nr:hypothetical protein ILUMI_00164 [Ignelater luminosus]
MLQTRSFSLQVIKEKRLDYQKKLAESKEEHQSFYEEGSVKRKTFLDQLIESSDKTGANLTDVELRDEVDTFMIAGSDTTASIVSFALVMLAMFPEMQDKVYEEVSEVLGSDKPVEWTDLGKFVYLERVLKETLRLFPVGIGVARSVSKELELDGYILPAGSTAVVITLALHRDPEVWPDPLRFDPDRFLPEEVSKRHPYSWIPFSGGPRNCIGPKYAMMAMKALTATVVRQYKLSTTYKKVEDIKLQFDVAIRPVHGYKISMELRSSA